MLHYCYRSQAAYPGFGPHKSLIRAMQEAKKLADGFPGIKKEISIEAADIEDILNLLNKISELGKSPLEDWEK